MATAIETIELPYARYRRVTEWRRDRTIPWDLALVTGTLTKDIGPGLTAGTIIHSRYLTRQAWADLQSRSA